MSLAGIRKSFGKHAAAVMIFFGVATLVTSFAWNITGKINPIAQHVQAQADVIATIDGVAVTRRQYDSALHDPHSQLASFSSDPMMQSFVRGQALEHVTEETEYYAAARRLGLKATDAQIAKYKSDILVKSNIRTELGLSSNASWDDVNNTLQQKGQQPLDVAYPQDELAEEVVLTQLFNTLKGTPVTDQDARDSFTQYHVQHILVDNKKRSDAQAKQRAEDLIKKLQAGANFSDMAKEDSDDPGTAKKGGDDGWIDVHTGYVPEFKTAAFALKPGAITPDPVQSPAFGYFIVKSIATRDTTPKDFDKRKAQIITSLEQERQQQSIQIFSQSIKNAPHNIVIKDPVIRAFKNSQDADQMAPGAQQTDLYNKAIADLQGSLADKTNPDGAAIQIRLAQIYQRTKQSDKAIAAYEAALKTTDSPELQMTLAGLYKDRNNIDLAVQHYQSASADAWDNVGTHHQLQAIYQQIGRKDLASTEAAWLADYAKQHKPVGPPPGSLPIKLGSAVPGSSVAPIVVGAKPVSAPAAVSAKSISARPGAVTAQPASGSVPPVSPKPTQ